ncbi:glutathione S-transferase-like [Homalodisca vitripennis]|uniref:glutathione S-transferase-like n=1 Tax=Homalodisca vitripennis TaxID=197043 RepID=UPI001EEC7E8A|nr:glutathione S-transferase-like [Homalodisca vitripennis]XP_046680425.1 glutathione S-transferase-like [Homalodisca vitripennis]
MAPKTKLTYFNGTGLGESIRFLLVYLDREYEDSRFEEEEWAKIKPTTPWGKVPLLEVEGEKPVAWSLAITRYLGREAGLAGANTWEDLRIDEIVYVINDLRSSMASYFHEENEAMKEYLKGPLFSTTIPFYLSRLESQVKENNGFLANGKLSWADVYFAALSDYLNWMNGSKEILVGYPNLQALKAKIFALPKIKEYVAKRPITIELQLKE